MAALREDLPEGGKSDYEIAEIMGITRTRVYQIRQRALKKLRLAILRDPFLADIARGILRMNGKT